MKSLTLCLLAVTGVAAITTLGRDYHRGQGELRELVRQAQELDEQLEFVQLQQALIRAERQRTKETLRGTVARLP